MQARDARRAPPDAIRSPDYHRIVAGAPLPTGAGCANVCVKRSDSRRPVSCLSVSAREMKLLIFLALIVMVNVGLFVWGQGPRVWSTTTADRWKRSCLYYYPVRTFEVILPLNENCPPWATPR
jgi:hypothetical protein